MIRITVDRRDPPPGTDRLPHGVELLRCGTGRLMTIAAGRDSNDRQKTPRDYGGLGVK